MTLLMQCSHGDVVHGTWVTGSGSWGKLALLDEANGKQEATVFSGPRFPNKVLTAQNGVGGSTSTVNSTS